jgi:hypothetical protein
MAYMCTAKSPADDDFVYMLVENPMPIFIVNTKRSLYTAILFICEFNRMIAAASSIRIGALGNSDEVIGIQEENHHPNTKKMQLASS